MVDILYLTWNRREFTEASLKALRENTDWSLVESITLYDDCSTDGTYEVREQASRELMPIVDAYVMGGSRHLASPVHVMNHWLGEKRFVAPIICKLDNDVIVPPGWLNESLAVMEAYPEVDLLGIEPGVGPRPDITAAGPKSEWPNPGHGRRAVYPCDYIGGIGLWKRSIFDGRDLPAANGRFGWGHWQEHHPELIKAWIAPGLPLFLLNRLPFEPWASLSAHYVAEGWQRPWPEQYTEADSHMWKWWTP